MTLSEAEVTFAVLNLCNTYNSEMKRVLTQHVYT